MSRPMFRRLHKPLLTLIAAGLAPAAFAVLDRAGPVDPAHGFPQWYMDRQGVALELCTNLNATVLSAGGCAILPGPVPAGVQTVPEVFPGNWATEHFYTLASASLTTAGLDKKTGAPVAGTGKLVVNMGLEASFPTATPTAGSQITFSRWRITHTNPACTGSYTYYTPNAAPATFNLAAGAKLAQTSDIGIGSFDGPLAGSTGPFLQWSATPGGAVKAPFVGPDGKKYIADYNAIGTAVTGSDRPNPLRGSTKAWIATEIKNMVFSNYVLVEGPGVASGNCAATEAVYTSTGFQLFGRYFEGPLPSLAQVDRATYRAVDTNADGLPDRFQVGVWALATQKPAGVVPTLGMSLYSGDPAAPTVQQSELAMTRSTFSVSTAGQPRYEYFQGATMGLQAGVPAALLARPASTTARVRITSDNPVSVLDVPLVDELRVAQALWDSVQKTLTVVAESGAYLAQATPATQAATNADCSIPCLTLDAQQLPALDAAGAPIDYKLRSLPGEKYAVMGVVVPNVHVPPPSVTVFSSGGGRDTQPVMYAGTATGTAILQPDVAATPMNVSVTIPVLANDVGVAPAPGLLICTAASGGTCAVPSATTACVANTATTNCTASGARLSLTADNRVVYAPRLNTGGITEAFWYQANTLNGVARSQVTVSVGAATGLPDARDDLGLTAAVNTASLFNVLANDFAPAGVNLASLRFTQTPCNLSNGVCVASAASFDAKGNLLFNPPTPGNWTLAYTFTDLAGTVADPGVVTITAQSADVLTFAKARWTAPKKVGQLGTLDASGTASLALNQPLDLYVPNVATGPQGCNNPTLGTRIGSATVLANLSWTFPTISLATQPTNVYVYSPTLGGCTQALVQ